MASFLIPFKLIIFLFFVPFTSSSSLTSMEAETLLKWKAGLDRNTQTLLSSLWIGSNHCEWTGITCDNTTGSVTNITLREYGTSLRGTLESLNFFYFPNLITFNVRNNSLYGPIPSHIGNLSKLNILDLSFNHFTGTIPPSVGLLKSLVVFSLETNSFHGPIPSYIGNLSKVTYFGLSFNNFSGIIPSEIGLLKSVENLYLGGNNIVGPIPPEIGNLPNLARFELYSNRLSGSIPEEIGTLSSVYLMDFSGNYLTGSIPASIGNISNLALLYLYDNSLSGSIPKEIGLLKSLVVLQLLGNNLTGVIPSSIGNLTNLSNLLLHRNSISGPLPPEIGMLKSINTLKLANNSISGPIPASIRNWNNATYVDFSGNRFSGAIPDRVCDRNNGLRYLALNDNRLEGKLPISLINCSDLIILNVADNKLNDTFPGWLGMLPKLRALILKSNRFHGSIPNSIPASSFSKLQMLDLSYNHFTGLLPMKLFQNLKALQEEAEFKNDVSYTYSVSLTIKGMERQYTVTVAIPIFTSIDLSINGFHGEIPEVVGDLRLLLALNLSHNSLTGSIPPSFGKLAELESLDLSSNKLSGRIPLQLTNLTFLAVLRLSNNNLVGLIPRGKQFETFENDSYSGNLGLCGFPLLRECSNDERPEEPAQDEEGNGNGMAFIWKVAMMGYGCGTILGMSMAYIVFTTGRPWWIVRIVERDLQNYITSWIQRKRY